jgi:hypothetical protein
MNLIGIDFSMTSTAVCIYTGKEYIYNVISRDWNSKSKAKTWNLHNILTENKIINLHTWEYKKKDNYIDKESLKIPHAEYLSNEIFSIIEPYIMDSQIAIEGPSYNSIGNSFIDLLQYNTIFRTLFYKQYNGKEMLVVPPTQVKKCIGKGNSNKTEIFLLYKEKEFENDILLQFIKSQPQNLFLEESAKKITVKKPMDDIIDSRLIIEYLKSIN